MINDIKKYEDKIELCKKEIADLVKLKEDKENYVNKNLYNLNSNRSEINFNDLLKIDEKIASSRKKLCDLEFKQNNNILSRKGLEDQQNFYEKMIWELNYWINEPERLKNEIKKCEERKTDISAVEKLKEQSRFIGEKIRRKNEEYEYEKTQFEKNKDYYNGEINKQIQFLSEISKKKKLSCCQIM